MFDISQGELQNFSDVAPLVSEAIITNLKAAGFAYPDMFEEFLRAQLQNCAGRQALVLPGDTTLERTLYLDYDQSWISDNNIAAVICLGDLSVVGDIVNNNLNCGPLLFVGGSLRLGNLIKGGAYFLITNHLVADNLVIVEYNDGVLRVGGDLTAELFINLDQDALVGGATNARLISQDEELLSDVFVAEVFDQDPDLPSADKIMERHRAGLNLLL